MSKCERSPDNCSFSPCFLSKRCCIDDIANDFPVSSGSSGCSAADEPQPDKRSNWQYAFLIWAAWHHGKPDEAIDMVGKLRSEVAGRSADGRENRLLPCPWCAAKAVKIDHDGYGMTHTKECCLTRIRGGDAFLFITGASEITAWNAQVNGSTK